jgi:hypothetical protein
MGEAPWVLFGLALVFAFISTPVVAWRAFLRGRDADAGSDASRSGWSSWNGG